MLPLIVAILKPGKWKDWEFFYTVIGTAILMTLLSVCQHFIYGKRIVEPIYLGMVLSAIPSIYIYLKDRSPKEVNKPSS